MNNPGYINGREYRRGNQKWTIQGNWQHRVHNAKKNTAIYSMQPCLQFPSRLSHILLTHVWQCDSELFPYLPVVHSESKNNQKKNKNKNKTKKQKQQNKIKQNKAHIKHYVHLINYKYRKFLNAYLINNPPMSPLIPISWWQVIYCIVLCFVLFCFVGFSGN
jgi:hypothetical protein